MDHNAAIIALRIRSNKEELSSSDDEEIIIASSCREEKHAKVQNYIEIIHCYNDLDFKSHFRLTKSAVEVNTILTK